MQSSNPYNISFSRVLLHHLWMNGIDPNDAIDFFTDQVEQLMLVQPNLKRNQSRAKYGVRQAFEAWVVRGYYPETRHMFKITMVATKDNDRLQGMNAEYFAKVYYVPPRRFDSWMMVDGTTLRKRHVERTFERTVFGDHSQLEPLFKEKLKTPKCMAPKGIKLLNLKQKKVERKKK